MPKQEIVCPHCVCLCHNLATRFAKKRNIKSPHCRHLIEPPPVSIPFQQVSAETGSSRVKRTRTKFHRLLSRLHGAKQNEQARRPIVRTSEPWRGSARQRPERRRMTSTWHYTRRLAASNTPSRRAFNQSLAAPPGVLVESRGSADNQHALLILLFRLFIRRAARSARG